MKKISNELEQKIIEAYTKGNGYTRVAKICNTNPSTVMRVLKRNNIQIRNNHEKSKLYFCNENYFEEINTPNKAYWLGFIYADGYVSINNNHYVFGIALSEKDCILLKKLNFELNSSYPIHTYKQASGYSENTVYCRLCITSQKIVNDLIKHGVVEHKTNILQPPNIDKELVPHFIRGYLDGDGCITCSEKSDGTLSYKVKILGTEPILDFIKNFIEKNEVATINRYYKRREDQLVSSIDFGGNNQVRKFLDLLYKDANIFLERKYEKYLDLCRYNNYSRSRRELLD